jgi:SAM-dependent methyltransferase
VAVDADKAVDINRLKADINIVGAVWTNHPYYEEAEKHTHGFWQPGSPFHRLFEQLDLESTVELACGHGRHSEQAVSRVGHLALVDIIDENLDVCRERLSAWTNVSYLKGDGATFQPIANDSTTAIFCYDAMVHFSPEMVKSYLFDTARILRKGGMALFHHSNYPAPLDRHWGQNPHARNHMTVELFDTLARNASLDRVESILLRWGDNPDLDALTLLRK